MIITACEATNRTGKFFVPGGTGWRVKALALMLLCLVLSVTTTISARAANQGMDFPVSIIDGTSPPQLQGEDQQNPTVVALPDKNKWLVVWEDWRNWASTGADIYGRFIDQNGNYCGNEFIICNQPGSQTVPTLAYRPGSIVLVAWQDVKGTPSSGFIYYNTIDVSLLDAAGNGFTIAGETAISYTSIGEDGLISRKRPHAAYDAARDLFWLVWVESRNALQRINENAFGVSDTAANVFWRFGDPDYIGYATIAGWDLTVSNPEILRNDTSAEATIRRISHTSTTTEDKYEYEYFSNVNNVTVTCDALSAETLIVWEGKRGKATLTCTFEEHEHEITRQDGEDEDGNPIYVTETEVQIEGPSYDDTFHSTLELGSWEGDTAGEVHIYSLFDKSIPLTVVQSQQLDAPGTSAHYPSVAFEPVSRKFLVAWEAQQENGFSKIYGQLLFSGGGPYGANLLLSRLDADGDGVQDDAIVTSNQTLPNIAVDRTNQQFLVTWQDGRNSPLSAENLDIYGQFVDCEGSLRGNNYAINTNGASQCCPHAAYNLGTHQFFMVWKDARNFLDTHSDIYGQKFDPADLQVYNDGLSATQIVLSATSSNATFSPLNLGFPTLDVADSSISRNITVKNTSDSIMEVTNFGTTTEVFSVDGISMDDNIPAGGSLTFAVTFSPTHVGTFDATLSLFFKSQADGTLIPCSVNLSGKANSRTTGNYSLNEAESFTADRNYQLNIEAFADQPGHLYVLLLHDPASGGTVYALTPSGNLVPFPYTSPTGWQDMYFAFQTPPSLAVNLSTINLQQLGCSACQGPFAANAAGDSVMFGTIPINSPSDVTYNCAADFKYLTGNLFVATYNANGTAGVPFDFNQGLMELLWLKIHSLNGDWKVTSAYNGQGREHADWLRVQEENGNISATWSPRYSNLAIRYATDESAYLMTFNVGSYNYVYKITNLDADRFSGTYTCTVNGEIIAQDQPVCGVRANSSLTCELPNNNTDGT
jgi:hypothetical protein